MQPEVTPKLELGARSLFDAMFQRFGRLMITTTEAAAVSGFSKSTLEAWRCRGGGPPFVKAGGVRYRIDLLAAWIERNTTRPVEVEAA